MNINKIKLSGTTYNIQDENACKVVELTQAEYDALPATAKTSNSLFVITDATAGDLSNYYTKSETSGATEISTALASKADTATTYTKTETDNVITAATSTKQDQLVSGSNIKTINNESILGSGNITIEGGGSSYTAGDGIDITNDVISVTGKVDTTAFTAHTADTVIHVTSAEKTAWNAKSDFSGDYNDLTNKPTIPTVPTSNTAFTNDAGYITIDAISGKVDTSTYNTYTAETDTAIARKQDNLVSGTNIKTINNESILGEGNITIEGGGGKAVSAGTNISITTGETADTINCTLPITASTSSNASKIIIDNNYSFISNDAVISGKNDVAHTSKSIVLGINTLLADGSGANIEYNLAFGERNNVTASGIYKASASQNFILGSNNSIYNASKCFALGTANNLKKNHQFVVGDYNTVLNEYETLFGRYNVSSSASTTFGNSGNTLFSVGNGTSDSARHNAFEIKQNGDIYIADTNDTSTTNYYEKPMIKLQDALGGGSSYTAGDGIDITNDVISVTGKVDTSAITTSITSASTNTQVPSAKAVYDQLGGLKLVKLTQAQYNALSTKDSMTLYIIEETQQCTVPATATLHTVDNNFDFTHEVYGLSFGSMEYLSEHSGEGDMASTNLFDANDNQYTIDCTYMSNSGTWELQISNLSGIVIERLTTPSFSCCDVFNQPMYLKNTMIPTIDTCASYECTEYECLQYDEETGECIEQGECINQECTAYETNYVLEALY